MPVLSNPRHERFAQELAKGKTADDAYVTAGYKENRHNASTLRTNQTISNRVTEIQSRAAARVEVTRASLILEAEEVRVAAMAAGQLSAAIAAIKEKGVLSGDRVEKRENRNTGADDMTDGELAAIIRRGGAGAIEQADSAKLIDRVH